MTSGERAVDAVEPFLGRHVEAGRGGDVALVTPSGSCTYAELAERVDRAAGALRGLGVEPEQRVALLLRDGVDLVASFFGAIKLGAVAVPLNTRLGAADHRAMLGDSRARVLVSEADLLAPLEPLGGLPQLCAVALASGERRDHPRLAELLARAEPVRQAEPMSDDDMAFWLYTSGTTGLPKATIHARRTMLATDRYGAATLGVTERDRALATSKLFFAYALGYALLTPLCAGARTYLLPQWADVPAVARVLEEFRPTLFFSVPTFYARLLRSDLPRDLFASLRHCVSAGERLPAEIFESFRGRFGVTILDAIGATETVFFFLANRPDRLRVGSSGVEAPGVEARILDPEGREVPTGEQGVLWVRMPSAATGYWNRLELTRQNFVGDWYRTRDVYRRDTDGFYHHLGREDDVFKVAGMWVSPAGLEAALLEHPDALEAGVVDAEDEMGLSKPVAFVVPKDASADRASLARELEALVERRLASHERPKRIVVVDELPRTPTGKLQRFRLRDEARALLRSPQGVKR